MKDVIWTGEKFVAVGETKYDDEPECNRVFVSTDGENWTYYQAPDEFQSIAWDGNVYVAVANGNNIYLSYDCVEWELVIKGYMDEIWFNRVMWGGGKFIAHGAYYSMCSEDGYKWRLMPSTAFFNIRLRDIIWDGSKYIAVGAYTGDSSTNKILICQDGETWLMPDEIIDFSTGDKNNDYQLNALTLGDNNSIVAVGLRFILDEYQGQKKVLATNMAVARVDFPSNGKGITYRFDGSQNLIEYIDAEGRSTKYEYFTDSSGRNMYGEVKKIINRYDAPTVYERDDNGNITKITNPDNTYKEFGYDDKNNLIFETDEVGNCMIYVYDSNRINLIKKAQSLTTLKSSDITRIKQQAQLYKDLSNYLDVFESKFAVAEYEYYPDGTYSINGLLSKMTDPEGKKVEYSYYSNGLLYEEIPYDDIYDVPSDKRKVYTYNNLGLLETETSPEGYKVKYEYDDNGWVVRISQYDKYDTEKGVKRIVYDVYGRITKEISPRFYKSSLDDLSSNTYYDNNNSDKDYYYTFTYYPSGKVKTITAPKGSDTSTEDTTTSYTYDAFGNILTETRPNESIYEYQYDVMNRLTKVSFKNSKDSQPVSLAAYGYMIVFPENKYGYLEEYKTEYIKNSTFENKNTTTMYDYAGRVVEQEVNDNKFTTTYYGNGNVASVTDPKGNTTRYYYEKLNL